MRKAEVTRSDWKRRRFFSSSFFVLLVALVCTRVFADDDSVEFPLPEYADFILIPVTLGNADHLCVLDSGCTAHIFHTSLRETLGNKLAERAVEAADGEPVNAGLYSAPDIKIGRILLHGSKTSRQDDQTGNFAIRELRSVRRSSSSLIDRLKGKDVEHVLCSDLTIAQQISGSNIEGMVGMPLFRANVVQLDFEHQRIRILPAATTPSSDWGQPINASLNDASVPTIDVELPDGIHATCIVDTGYDGTISLSSALFRKLSDSHNIIAKDDALVWQVSGIKTNRFGELAGAKFGGFQNSGLRAEDGGTNNRIGLQYLRRFLVTLDLGRKKIYLKTNAKFVAPNEIPAVGMRLLRKNDLTIVHAVFPNGPGERAGIQANDELISVGGEAVRSKPTAEIRWLYREKADANGHLTLAMRRDGVERNVDVVINK